MLTVTCLHFISLQGEIIVILQGNSTLVMHETVTKLAITIQLRVQYSQLA